MKTGPKPVKIEKVTAKYLRKNLRYVATTGELWWKICYNKRPVSAPAGWIGPNGYCGIKIFGKSYKVHRVIWCMQTGKWPPRSIDHINTTKWDNRWKNLRLATRRQNGRNRHKQKNNRSGYKGVCKHQDMPRWTAQIKVNGKMKYLGLYRTPKAAHAAYRKAARKYFGEYARF